MNNRMETLYRKLSTIDDQELYSIEAEFCAALHYGIPAKKKPMCVTAFLTISNWFATSQRSGAWTFYEATPQKDIELTLQYLNNTGDDELASIFRCGVHDYQNPIYADNFNYPEEWFNEANEIDAWIEKHKNLLYEWERRLLTDNRELFCRLVNE